MTTTASVRYLVSGGEDDLKHSTMVLRRSGRDVRHDIEVDDDAQAAFAGGGRFVVVAHGRSDGTVMLARSDRDAPAKWLWVGMPVTPTGAFIYLYACHAGAALPAHLGHSVCFGHRDTVPMPIEDYEPDVLEYLDRVDGLMRAPALDLTTIGADLFAFVEHEWVAEQESPTSTMRPWTMYLLWRSLNPRDVYRKP